MTDATKFQFTNPAVPKAYDEYFVPRLFEPWAKLVLDEARLQPGQALIDVATGPGTVARLAAPLLGPKGRILATDIAKPMLDIARAKPAQRDAAAIEYVESGAAPLAAPSGAFDVLICQQGLQFFPDRSAALREMHRVLKNGGRALIAIWAEIERNQIFAAFHRALGATVPAELAALITAPFSWYRAGELRAAAAGLARRCRAGVRARPRSGRPLLQRDAGLARRCRAGARDPGRVLHEAARRALQALARRQAGRRDGLEHHRRAARLDRDHYKKSRVSRLPSLCRVSYTARRSTGKGGVAEDTIYMRTARKALEASGGADSLAAVLGRPLCEVNDWLAGREVPPDRVFLELLEIVSRRR